MISTFREWYNGEDLQWAIKYGRLSYNEAEHILWNRKFYLYSVTALISWLLIIVN